MATLRAMQKAIRGTDVGKPRIKWLQIRNEYTTAAEAISKQDLADKYGINRTTLSLKATKEKWDFERGRFIIHLQEQTAEKKSDAVSSFAATWDTKCSDAADKLLAKAVGEMVEGKSKDVAAAMKIAQDMGKAASGGKPDGVLEQLMAEIKKALE